MQQSPHAYFKQSEYPSWHYQPLRLLKQEMENPLEVIKAFFSGYTLPQARKHFKEMLEDAVCNVEMYSINYLTLYNSIEKLIEAAWLIKQKEQNNTAFPLPGEGSQLPSLIQLLVVNICPERIFFLSDKESEVIDLLIIVPDNRSKPFTHYGTLIEILSYGIDISFSLHPSSVFHRHIEEAHPFWLSVCTEEKQLYTGVPTPFPYPEPGKREGVAEKMRSTFLTGMAKSCSLLEAAQANRLHGSDGITLFLLHQSAELVCRALILSLTGSEVREHSLSILRKHLSRCAPEVCQLFPNDTDEEKALLSLLDSAYRRGRYDNSFAPGREQLTTLFKRIEQLHNTADASFTKIIRSLEDQSSP